uniref:Uncharacterized protein n=1 Tax=Siphoviridae sp. ct2hZ16 TaxID=2826276 RepID=A0A8S5QUB2_9CAUD|nr:MAG TPA: hypothetical protein [Siphoviridae sp. ct2hZ16]
MRLIDANKIVEVAEHAYGACNVGAIAPACILNPEFLNLRKEMAYVEEVSE